MTATITVPHHLGVDYNAHVLERAHPPRPGAGLAVTSQASRRFAAHSAATSNAAAIPAK
jgi:hypothetical protein